MTRQGVDIPVLLGGAALTRNYVEEDCATSYGSGRVAYARDAFDGLDLMDKVVGRKFDEHVQTAVAKRKDRPSNTKRVLGQAARPLRPWMARKRRCAAPSLPAAVPVPVPPFWGPASSRRCRSRHWCPTSTKRMLYQFQWGFRKAGKSLDEYKAWAQHEVKPIMKRILDMCAEGCDPAAAGRSTATGAAIPTAIRRAAEAGRRDRSRRASACRARRARAG